MPFILLSLMLCVFGITTGEFVIAGILPDIAGDLQVSIPAAGLQSSPGVVCNGAVQTVRS